MLYGKNFRALRHANTYLSTFVEYPEDFIFRNEKACFTALLIRLIRRSSIVREEMRRNF